jgi:hypothetical protein
MSISGNMPRENLTLTEANLAACRPIVGEGGHVRRALCPFHGSDRQRSLRVQVHSGRFVCFACGAWGYMDTARAQWCEEQQRQAAFRRPPTRQQRGSHYRQPPSPLPSRQEALRSFPSPTGVCPSSVGPRLTARGIPGCPARQSCGSVSAAAWHSPGISVAAGGRLCSARDLATRRPRRPRGLSAYDARRVRGEPLRSCGRDSRAGAQGQAPRSSPRRQGVLQRCGAAGG